MEAVERANQSQYCDEHCQHHATLSKTVRPTLNLVGQTHYAKGQLYHKDYKKTHKTSVVVCANATG
jgi:hypothetical protein